MFIINNELVILLWWRGRFWPVSWLSQNKFDKYTTDYTYSSSILTFLDDLIGEPLAMADLHLKHSVNIPHDDVPYHYLLDSWCWYWMQWSDTERHFTYYLHNWYDNTDRCTIGSALADVDFFFIGAMENVW